MHGHRVKDRWEWVQTLTLRASQLIKTREQQEEEEVVEVVVVLRCPKMGTIKVRKVESPLPAPPSLCCASTVDRACCCWGAGLGLPGEAASSAVNLIETTSIHPESARMIHRSIALFPFSDSDRHCAAVASSLHLPSVFLDIRVLFFIS